MDHKAEAIRAAWAIYYGQPFPPPPMGVSEARWAAMVKQAQWEISEAN